MATQIWTVSREGRGIVGSYSDMERALDAIGAHGAVEPSRGRAVSGMEHWEYGSYAVDVSTLDAPISVEVEAGSVERPPGERAARRAAHAAPKPQEHKATTAKH